MNPTEKKGFNSYSKNKTSPKNPHVPGTGKYNDFDRGWTQALKRSPSSPIKYEQDSFQVRTPKESNITIEAEAYANRKGGY